MNEGRPNLVLVDEAAEVVNAEAVQPKPTPEQEQPAPQVAQLSALSPALRKKVQREFKEWKAELQEIIRRGASISLSMRGGSLTYQFVLPPRLVKLVWSTTIKERVQMERLRQQEGAELRAVDGIRQEVDAAVRAVQEHHAKTTAAEPAAAPTEGQDALLEGAEV